jgi:uncharacterized protein YdaU (DUF1376 family)
MSRAWMPIYWGDYLADTRHLTTLQHGIYLLLIAHYWQHGGLPQRAKYQICGLTPQVWRANSRAIAKLFLHPGWRHKRIDAELQKAKELSEKRAVLGALGGRSNRGLNNWQRHKGKTSREAIAKQTVAQSHKKDKKEVAEAVDNVDKSEPKRQAFEASPSLQATMRAKDWI